MSIILDDKCRAILHVDVFNGNMLAAVRQMDGYFQITLRIRMNRDDKVWDSKDERKWWELKTFDSLDTILAKLRLIFEEAPFRQGPVYEIIGNGDPSYLMNEIMKIPGMHKMDLPAKEKPH